MAQPLEVRGGISGRFLILALLSPVLVLGSVGLWGWLTLTPLQGEYLGPYGASQMGSGRGRALPFAYIVKTAPKRQPEIAHEADVVPPPHVLRHQLPLVLSTEARAAGWTGLAWGKSQRYPADKLNAMLQEQFFNGRSFPSLLLIPLVGGMLLLLLVFKISNRSGSKSKHEDRHGRRTKGPELVRVSRLGLRSKGDGIGLRLASKWGPLSSSYRIPQRLESSHILLMGDTGSGKSNAIRQILRQVEERGESAVVYDPAGEFVQEFCRPERDDLILNPLDERCPYWDLAGEISGQGIAEALAAAMLPSKERENSFFTDAPRRVLARLLHSRPSVQQLLAWMSDPGEIERLMQGTPQAAYLDRNAGPQRAGVLASLNMISDSLALLPKIDGLRQSFGTHEWRSSRTRWVFLTSRPTLRERILPLHSAWLDLMILRMMEPCANPAKPVWFVLDELASLNRLPQLHTAVTENRKYGNPVVLGFQGRSQLEKRYGQDAEAMLSQPATKIFFKSSEPRAAKWISETLGDVEVERLRESHTPGLLRTKKQFAIEITTKPLVMASEIAGLAPLSGYIKQENRVVPVRFQFVPKRPRQPEFIERKMEIPELRSVSPPSVPDSVVATVPALIPAATEKHQPEKPESSRRFERGTVTAKPREWDESQWID